MTFDDQLGVEFVGFGPCGRDAAVGARAGVQRDQNTEHQTVRVALAEGATLGHRGDAHLRIGTPLH